MICLKLSRALCDSDIADAMFFALDIGRRGLCGKPDSCIIAFLPVPDSVAKEYRLVEFVRSSACEPDSVAAAIDIFARTREWLKVTGGAKRAVVRNCLQRGDWVVEFGT